MRNNAQDYFASYCALLRNQMYLGDILLPPCFHSALDVHVSGGYAYVTTPLTPGFSLEVIDISDPQNPVIAGYFGTAGGNPQDLHVSGGYAYGVHEGFDVSLFGGLRVIDVRNPQSPAFISSIPTPGLAKGLYASGEYAYVADGEAGLQLIDRRPVVNPANRDAAVAAGDSSPQQPTGSVWQIK